MNGIKEKDLDELKGDLAIGHVRYSTSGKSNPLNIQPFVAHFYGGYFAIAHNGNIVNAEEIKNELERDGAIFHSTSDTEVFVHLIARAKEKPPSHIICMKMMRSFYPYYLRQ